MVAFLRSLLCKRSNMTVSERLCGLYKNETSTYLIFISACNRTKTYPFASSLPEGNRRKTGLYFWKWATEGELKGLKCDLTRKKVVVSVGSAANELSNISLSESLPCEASLSFRSSGK